MKKWPDEFRDEVTQLALKHNAAVALRAVQAGELAERHGDVGRGVGGGDPLPLQTVQKWARLARREAEGAEREADAHATATARSLGTRALTLLSRDLALIEQRATIKARDHRHANFRKLSDGEIARIDAIVRAAERAAKLEAQEQAPGKPAPRTVETPSTPAQSDLAKAAAQRAKTLKTQGQTTNGDATAPAHAPAAPRTPATQHSGTNGGRALAHDGR